MDKIIGPVLDFLKWLLVFWRTGKAEPEVDLVQVFNFKRAELEKAEVALLEFLEDDPGNHFSTHELFVRWRDRCVDWFGAPAEELAEGEVYVTLRDWANDTYAFVVRTENAKRETRWVLNPEYDKRLIRRGIDRTVMRRKEQ